jgi:hypothetical protein
VDYIIRVELHGASYAHYEKLHAVLAAKGVFNVIAGTNGMKYRLPPAEYSYSGSESPAQVLAAVVELAATVLPNPAVLVTQRTACTWQGLLAA